MGVARRVDRNGRTYARPIPADAPDALRTAMESAEVAPWTWNPRTDDLRWLTARSTLPGLTLQDGPWEQSLAPLVHPEQAQRLRTAVDRTLAGDGPLNLEFRPSGAVGDDRLLLVRGRLVADADGVGSRLIGVLLDVTDRVRARDAHDRLLNAERRAGRRAAALRRLSAALSEAATTEQVAAVMVEESLRRLGADAARIELRSPTTHPDDAVAVVRSAGVAELLRESDPAAPVPRDAVRDETATAARIELPLIGHGRLHGLWTLAWHRRPDDAARRGDWIGPEATALLGSLATECAEALDRARLYEQQREIATVLQRTLLPSGLPPVPGAEVAARYQPGGRAVDVGGDWYDVITLPDGRVGLVIGDVEGHSAEAAAVMGQVRNALRAYAVEGCTPATLMERLNRLLVRLAVPRLVTCCYAEFSAREGTVTLVLAGHPPPLLVHPNGVAQYAPAPPNLVLGVDESVDFVESTVLLDPGARLLLYTDGLIEHAHRPLSAGMAALRGWAAAADPEDTTDEFVARVLRGAQEGLTPSDDVAVLALRHLPADRRPTGRLRTVRRILPLDPASAAAARRFVSDVLDQWGHHRLTPHVALMTSELVTNSVLHTTGELELGLFLDLDRLRVEVVDHSDRLPTVQIPDDDATGGRGLLIIDALARDWGVDGRGGGKAVWFEVPIGDA